MIILIDNGHGKGVHGKASPDGAVQEWQYTRGLAKDIVDTLTAMGYDARLTTPEDWDLPICERVPRINSVCREKGAAKVLSVSIHLNASGNGAYWGKARGWQVHVAPKCFQTSKDLATCLADAAFRSGLAVRKPAPSVPYWTQDLAICRGTMCASVLTENLFMDNRDDAALLLGKGRQAIIDTHVTGIIDFINSRR